MSFTRLVFPRPPSWPTNIYAFFPIFSFTFFFLNPSSPERVVFPVHLQRTPRQQWLEEEGRAAAPVNCRERNRHATGHCQFPHNREYISFSRSIYSLSTQVGNRPWQRGFAFEIQGAKLCKAGWLWWRGKEIHRGYLGSDKRHVRRCPRLCTSKQWTEIAAAAAAAKHRKRSVVLSELGIIQRTYLFQDFKRADRWAEAFKGSKKKAGMLSNAKPRCQGLRGWPYKHPISKRKEQRGQSVALWSGFSQFQNKRMECLWQWWRTF